MNRLHVFLLLLPCCLASVVAGAQTSDAPGPVGGAPAALPEIRVPSADEIRLPVPRPIQAASAMLGLGRQRLALVVGLSRIGSRVVVDPAPRDVMAVSLALRDSGYVVMRRDDVSGADLRAALAEFRARLQPGGIGFVYVAALGVQVDGVNLLLPRDTPLAGDMAPPQLTRHGVPLAEVAQALAGTPESQRLLVVDAAFRHPALQALPQAGLAEQRLPPGVMALFAQGLGVAQEVPAVAPLPEPAPTAARDIAATPFARTLVGALTTPRVSGPAALQATRRGLFDASNGRINPWLAGDTASSEEFAEATLLDGVIPQTPEEVAREGVRQVGGRLMRPAGAATAGEQSVTEVLAQTGQAPGGRATTPAETPRSTAADAGEAARGGRSLAGQVAGAVGTAAGVAATAAVVGAGVKAAEVAAVAGAAQLAAGAVADAAGAAAGTASALGVGRGVAAAPAAATTVAALPASPATAAADTVAAAARRTPELPAATIASQLAQGPGDDRTPAPAATGPATRPTDGRTVRGPEGGERPAWTPRTNAHGYAEGDSYTYQLVDTWKDEVIGRTTTTIEEVLSDGALRANGSELELDPQGRVTQQRLPDGSTARFEPAQELWWAKPKRGERRDVAFKEIFQRADRVRGETEWTGSSRVGRPRKVETPAGEFEVLPIESSGWFQQRLANGARRGGQWSRTVYYSPELGHPVAIEIQDADRLGKLLRRERVELLHTQNSRPRP